MSKLPSIVITGASGFVGTHFIDRIKDDFRIFAIARRSQKESGVSYHHNIHWLQCDIANWERVSEVRKYIKLHNGADFFIHMAAFYDFDYSDNEEYERTNVLGTANMLKMAEALFVKRFIFSSSLAACKFPKAGDTINERTPADANFAYAKSKRKGEEMVYEYSQKFNCTTVRFAAVFSDWCEYAPLYKFLSTWLSDKWDSKIIGGKGNSAVSYIHIYDLVNFLSTIILKTDSLPKHAVYNVSPDGCTSHIELFRSATLNYYEFRRRAIHMPKILCYPGLFLRNYMLPALKLSSKDPFERFWMLKYLDVKLNVDSSFTQKQLGWKPTPRYEITRRMPFLLEKMKNQPQIWTMKNEAAMKKVPSRPGFVIYNLLLDDYEKILSEIVNKVFYSKNSQLYRNYKKVNENKFRNYYSSLFYLVIASIRSGDRSLVLDYITDIARLRFAVGFQSLEICSGILEMKNIMIENLKEKEELKNMEKDIYEYIGSTIQTLNDVIEEVYDNIENNNLVIGYDNTILPNSKELQKTIKQLSAFYQIFPDDH
ncbi:MAG: NAD(P)-dependent oxidoreductase [Saprospiraceae bacterium]|nr:NAD(P)-dependent oxidoreductase [Saprospiraceae bacterium]